MGNIHKIVSAEKEFTLNFNSYAVMQLYKKYGAEGLETITVSDLNFDMIRWGLSENGRVNVSEAEVYDFIDGIGGVNSDMFLETIKDLVFQALKIPVESKKKEETEAV